MPETYSLDEVAAELRLYDAMKDPVRWLSEQIVRGRITAQKFGRQWRMTRSDIDAALDALANNRSATNPPLTGGPSAGSMRRRVPPATTTPQEGR